MFYVPHCSNMMKLTNKVHFYDFMHQNMNTKLCEGHLRMQKIAKIKYIGYKMLRGR